MHAMQGMREWVQLHGVRVGSCRPLHGRGGAIWAWLLPCKRAMQCIRGPGLCTAIFWPLLGPPACFKGAPCKQKLLLTRSNCTRDPVVVTWAVHDLL